MYCRKRWYSKKNGYIKNIKKQFTKMFINFSSYSYRVVLRDVVSLLSWNESLIIEQRTTYLTIKGKGKGAVIDWLLSLLYVIASLQSYPLEMTSCVNSGFDYITIKWTFKEIRNWKTSVLISALLLATIYRNLLEKNVDVPDGIDCFSYYMPTSF